MSDEAMRTDHGCTPLLDHRGAPQGPPFPARLATFDGQLQRLEGGWLWRGRMANDGVAELLARAVRGHAQRIVGPGGAGASVWIGDVWFDAATGGMCCELIGRAGEALGSPTAEDVVWDLEA
jgi:hypothetical protein